LIVRQVNPNYITYRTAKLIKKERVYEELNNLTIMFRVKKKEVFKKKPPFVKYKVLLFNF
tara:strand:+ start:161 stop:340 length:180 start_codon:yes stop_codon:yes gene_type:complete